MESASSGTAADTSLHPEHGENDNPSALPGIPELDPVTAQHVESAWTWFRSVGSPRWWLAPMVGQSEPAFRMLARQSGAHICHTEMIDASGFARRQGYRAQYIPILPQDRPLVVQLGGSNPEDLVEAARLAAPHCDAVELNVGCPQRCARKGGYGSFLMDRPDHLLLCVRAVARGVLEGSKEVERAQASGLLIGAGSEPSSRLYRYRYHEDMHRCLDSTKADGVMSGCGALKRPHVFGPLSSSEGDAVHRVDSSLAYIELARRHHALPRQVSKHLGDMIPHAVLRAQPTLDKAIKGLLAASLAAYKSGALHAATENQATSGKKGPDTERNIHGHVSFEGQHEVVDDIEVGEGGMDYITYMDPYTLGIIEKELILARGRMKEIAGLDEDSDADGDGMGG